MIASRIFVVGSIAVLTLLTAGGLLWTGLSPGDGAARLQPDDATVVARGKAVYVSHCAACHGANLEGQADWRTPLPSGRLPAPPPCCAAIRSTGPADVMGSNTV